MISVPSVRARLRDERYPFSLAAWCLPVVLTLAAAVRLVNLTFHSLWLDEAVSLNWARLPLSELVRRTIALREDSHPPLYYAALHLWIRLFGDSEAALRCLSVVAGLVLVALIYLLGRDIAGRRVGLLAASLAAMSPYLVWYSQETRMYAVVGALTGAAFYCLWRGLTGGGWWWAGYIAAAVAAMYAQIIASLLLPCHALVMLLFWRSNRRAAAQGLAALALAGLALVPLAVAGWQSSGATSTERMAPAFLPMLADTVQILLLRQVPDPWRLLALPAVVLASLGLVVSMRRPHGQAIALFLLVPLVLIYVLSATRLPIFGPPYIIILAPALLLAVALGIDALWQRRPAAGMAALAALALVSAFALRYNWHRDLGKEDWRSAARYVAAYARPGDAVLLLPNYVRLPFTYYFTARTPTLAPFGTMVQPEQLAPALESLQQYDRVWLILSHSEQIDPAGNVRAWVMQRYPVVTEQYPRGVEIRLLNVHYRRPVPAPGNVLATFGDRLHLTAVRADNNVEARDDIYHPPSGWVHAELQWQRLDGADAAGLRVRLRVVDGMGRVWGERLERATEVWRFYPPERWQQGEIVEDAYDVNMNPRTPPGRYRLELQVLDSRGQPLPVQTGTTSDVRLLVTDVEVH